MKTLLALVLLLALGPGRTIHAQISIVPFKETAQGELRLHIFTSANHRLDSSKPAIIFFFGGGWNGGSPTQFYPQAEYLAKRGMVAVTAEYRTKNQHGTDPRACVMDAKSAVRWIRSHAAKLGIDPDRIAAGGGSSGGHLAAATALIDHFNEPDEDTSVSCLPQALVLFNPVFDNSPDGYGYEQVKGYWERFSPMNNLKKGAPPTIIFLGTQDDRVPVATAEKYRDIMVNNGDRCDLHLYEYQAHGFFNKARYAETLNETDKFFVSLGWIDEMKQ